jgi:hypothetical protein
MVKPEMGDRCGSLDRFINSLNYQGSLIFAPVQAYRQWRGSGWRKERCGISGWG